MSRLVWLLGPALAVVAAVGLGLTGAARADVVQAPALDRGRLLYTEQCQTCHQPDGSGQVAEGIPSLHGVGAAAVDFYLATGRMPEATLQRQAPRKPPFFDAADRAAIVAYVTTSWPGGPDIPTYVSGASGATVGDLQGGGDLFRTNCAACHGAVGAGAALAHGAYAPSLHRATPVQVAEAVRVGPGNMPVFDTAQLTDQQVADVVTYVEYLHHPRDAGGAGLGHTGPIAEGFVGLLFGLCGAVGVATWVGHRSEDELQERGRG